MKKASKKTTIKIEVVKQPDYHAMDAGLALIAAGAEVVRKALKTTIADINRSRRFRERASSGNLSKN